jgi:hypothetical protein
VKNCNTISSSKCIVCLSGYYLDNASPNDVYPICTICPIYCSRCTSATICTACTDTSNYIFVDNLGSTICGTIASINCRTALNYYCTDCLSNFYNSYIGIYPICTICPTYCSSCTSATICTACTDNNYILVNTLVTVICATIV